LRAIQLTSFALFKGGTDILCTVCSWDLMVMGL
jgi:hypothetical protein